MVLQPGVRVETKLVALLLQLLLQSRFLLFHFVQLGLKLVALLQSLFQSPFLLIHFAQLGL